MLPTTNPVSSPEHDAARLLAAIDSNGGRWREFETTGQLSSSFGWTRARFVNALRAGVKAGTMVAVPTESGSMFLTRRPEIEGQTSDARQASIRANLKLLERDGWWFDASPLASAPPVG